MHATGLYIDYMNNSLAKKEIMKRKKKRERKLPNRVRTQDDRTGVKKRGKESYRTEYELKTNL